MTGETVPPVDETLPEVARIFELDRRLARRVAAARTEGAFPLVLGGNCCSCLGTVAGAGAPAVVWLDAHADFDTPDDNLSGFTDVMGLAILTGSGWRALRETIPGFAPVREADVVLAGVRDLEPYQRERLAASAVRTVPGAIDRAALLDALDGCTSRTTRLPARRPRRARRRRRPRESLRRAGRPVARGRAGRGRRGVRPLRRVRRRAHRLTTRARTATARSPGPRGSSRAASPSA